MHKLQTTNVQVQVYRGDALYVAQILIFDWEDVRAIIDNYYLILGSVLTRNVWSNEPVLE